MAWATAKGCYNRLWQVKTRLGGNPSILAVKAYVNGLGFPDGSERGRGRQTELFWTPKEQDGVGGFDEVNRWVRGFRLMFSQVGSGGQVGCSYDALRIPDPIAGARLPGTPGSTSAPAGASKPAVTAMVQLA